jgi:hypothetical protein
MSGLDPTPGPSAATLTATERRQDEEELVGAVFLHPEWRGDLQGKLKRGDFTDPALATAYAAAMRVEFLTVQAATEYLTSRKTPPPPGEPGWAGYLSQLMDKGLGLSRVSLQSHANAIRARAIHARRRDLCLRMGVAAANGDHLDQLLPSFMKEAEELQREQSNRGRPVPVDLLAVAAEGIPPVPWLIEGWLTADDIAILAGGAYSGKSTLCYDLAQALSTGRPWCGITPEKSIRVLVIDEEQGRRAASRLMLRLGGHNDNLRLFSGAGFGVGTDDGLAILSQEITDFQPRLVVFDSMTHLIAGIESENDSMLMGEVFRRLLKLREDHNTAILVIDHRGKWGRQGMPAPSELLDLILRGSTVKGTQASAVFAMIRVDDNAANLIQAKRREGDRLLSLRIGYETTDDDRILLRGLGTPEDLLGKGAKAQLWVTAYLQERGLALRSEILAAGVSAGHESRAIERALTDLKRAGRVETPRRGTYRLTLGGSLAEPALMEVTTSDVPF